MRDYKARPGRKGRKPARRSPPPRLKRASEALPKGYPPLARPQPPRREGPGRIALALRGLRRWPLRTLLFGSALAWMLAGLASGGLALLQAPLREVVLEGNAAVPAQEVLRLGGLSAGLSMQAVDPFDTAQRIAAHPRVTSVDVRRLYPGRVAIRLRERQPELRVRLRDGRTALVDRENVVLSLLPAGQAPPAELSGLPLVAVAAGNAAPSQLLRDPGIERGRAVLRTLQRLQFGAQPPLVIDAGNPFLLTLLLRQGTRLIVPPEHLESALRVYRAIAERYPLAFESGGAVDLTTLAADGSGRIVLRRR